MGRVITTGPIKVDTIEILGDDLSEVTLQLSKWIKDMKGLITIRDIIYEFRDIDWTYHFYVFYLPIGES